MRNCGERVFVFHVQSSPRAGTAYQALRQAIIEQALLPGAKLPEDQLGGHFGMSRTLVRATLSRLQAEGLVDARPKRTASTSIPRSSSLCERAMRMRRCD
ncbi:MAG: GntR family transcriptional regulator [Methylobacteriaceae bacterium]|nr:GntR family transcriptional regulator [Methylobacteriaceae bacterium]